MLSLPLVAHRRVCACMQTQHKVQLDERDRWGLVLQPRRAVQP